MAEHTWERDNEAHEVSSSLVQKQGHQVECVESRTSARAKTGRRHEPYLGAHSRSVGSGLRSARGPHRVRALCLGCRTASTVQLGCDAGKRLEELGPEHFHVEHGGVFPLAHDESGQHALHGQTQALWGGGRDAGSGEKLHEISQRQPSVLRGEGLEGRVQVCFEGRKDLRRKKGGGEWILATPWPLLGA